MNKTKVVIAVIMAVLALSAIAGTATALRSLSINGSTTLTLNGRITFRNPVGDIVCNVTVTKTVSRTIPKINRILIGKITRVDVPARLPEPNCRQANLNLERIIFLLEGERGRILYGGILGTLPRITGLLVHVDQFRAGFTSSGIGPCLYEPPAEGILLLAAINGGIIENLRFERNTASKIEGPFLCPASGELEGTLIPLQRTTVTLI